jgi:hypothetical protein
MGKLEHETLSPEDMRGWLQQELRDLLKATELRIQDATDFVTAYAAGNISEEQMRERRSVYLDRWGDSPIPGVTTHEGMTNAEIIKRIDDALPAAVRESVRRRIAPSSREGKQR